MLVIDREGTILFANRAEEGRSAADVVGRSPGDFATPEVEAAIQESLFAMMEGKTVIAIAHRLSTIAALDRLIVLDEGRIVEEGSHSELVASGGLYAQLWKRQSGGFLPTRLAAE